MKPETASPSFNHELPPTEHSGKLDYLPNIPSPESGVQRGAEEFEQKSESGAVASDIANLTAVLPKPIADDTAASLKISTASDVPDIAADDDLIEKEWVDKAKKIVAETKSDPYQQEESIGKLQVDYIKKRYGREIGADK